jgi:hypothetical protein
MAVPHCPGWLFVVFVLSPSQPAVRGRAGHSQRAQHRQQQPMERELHHSTVSETRCAFDELFEVSVAARTRGKKADWFGLVGWDVNSEGPAHDEPPNRQSPPPTAPTGRNPLSVMTPRRKGPNIMLKR